MNNVLLIKAVVITYDLLLFYVLLINAVVKMLLFNVIDAFHSAFARAK